MRARTIRHFLLLVALYVATLATVPQAAAAPTSRERRASRIAASAFSHLKVNDLDSRRAAIHELEEATLLDPERPDWDLTLARTYMLAGYLGLARHRFEKVKSYAPADADARFGLGQVWRSDWLKYLDLDSRDRAIENFSIAARLETRRADAWIVLVPMLVERGDLRAAAAAAYRALEIEPGRADARLADAYTSYRQGRVAHADSVFADVVPRLPRSIRARFEDIAPVATERDTFRLRRTWPKDRPAFIERFWRAQDPDLATPENEARLEYWSRVAHAYLLYYDARRGIWDERGEVYVRYGAPAKQIYNGVNEALTLSTSGTDRWPMNVLEWDYPELGMTVKMQDRTLGGFYSPELRANLIDVDVVDPAPDPDSLARRDGLFATAGGRGIFPALPPGVRSLPVEATVARFEGERGGRLLGQMEVPASPGDSLTATWVVRDSNEVEVARASRPLSPSACTPTEAQVADFTGELPPGRYDIGLSVRGDNGRRGTYREPQVLGADDGTLNLSDLVVSCGVPDASDIDPAHPAVRIEPNPGARIAAGDPLTAYFEIYHLTPAQDGMTHFQFEYVVRSLRKDARVWIQRLLAPRPQPQPIHTSREEQQSGSLRRQFVSVPLTTLPPGPYRLEITVRDLVTQNVATASAEFEYRAPRPPAN